MNLRFLVDYEDVVVGHKVTKGTFVTVSHVTSYDCDRDAYAFFKDIPITIKVSVLAAITERIL